MRSELQRSGKLSDSTPPQRHSASGTQDSFASDAYHVHVERLITATCLLSRLFGVKGQQSVISGMSSNHSLWCVFWEKCFNISKRRFTCFTETCCVPFLLSLYFVLSRVRNILETPRWAVWRFMKNIFKHEATMALTSLLSHNKNTCLVYTQSKYSGREYTQWWMRYS